MNEPDPLDEETANLRAGMVVIWAALTVLGVIYFVALLLKAHHA